MSASIEPWNINHHELPADGLYLEGEVNDSIFTFRAQDNIEFIAPLYYELEITRPQSDIEISANLQASFNYDCVRCLKNSRITITLENSQLCEPVQGHQTDITPFIAEEIILNFPDNPKCEHADTKTDCQWDTNYEHQEEDEESIKNEKNPWKELEDMVTTSSQEQKKS